MNIRVVIAGEHARLPEALAQDIEVVARVRTAKAALTALVAHAPRVLVTDAEMPDMSGPELAAVVQRNHPATRVIVVRAEDGVIAPDAFRTRR